MRADYGKLCRLTGMKGKCLSAALESFDREILAQKEAQLQKEKEGVIGHLFGGLNAENSDLFVELETLIGLDSVKQQVREIATLIDRRGRDKLPCIHMAFKGNPGTAKTTVARILANIFIRIGVSSNPNAFVETDSTGLIAKYVGHTAPLIKETVGKAQGGVLFIDEAYGIAPTIDNDRTFGREALATLVKEMEDKRDTFVCIMAGYTEEMNRFIDINPGLRDRIAFHLDFPDYTAEECVQIFEKFAKTEEYELSTIARKALLYYFEQALIANNRNFSNGRLARRVFERAKLKQAMRSAGNTLEAEDIKLAINSDDLKTNSTSAGFGFTHSTLAA